MNKPSLKEVHNEIRKILGDYTFTIIAAPVMEMFLRHLDSKGMTQRKYSIARYCCSFITGLISMAKYHQDKEWVIASADKIAKFCLMSPEEVRGAKDVCSEMGLIEVTREGTGKKYANRYKVNIEVFYELLKLGEFGLSTDKIQNPCAELSSVNILKDNKYNKVQLSKDNCSADAKPSAQKTLFSMPFKPVEKFSGYSGKKREALEAVDAARRTGNWSNVTDTDFTYYFIVRHKEILGSDTHYNPMMIGANTKEFRDNFLSLHKIPRYKIADCIDAIIEKYSQDPRHRGIYQNLITFKALGTVLRAYVMSYIDSVLFTDLEIKGAMESIKAELTKSSGIYF